MNKRNIIYTVIAIVILVAGGLTYSYFSSFRKVTIDIVEPDATADIYQGDKKIDTVSGNKTLSLWPGDYYATVQGEKYDPSHVNFTVASSEGSIDVDPGLSENYINTFTKESLPILEGLLTAKYASVLGGFTMNIGKLYRDGSWYGMTLAQSASAPGNNGDVYRVIFQKVDNKWQIATTPSIVLSAPDYKNIPFSVLDSVNSQSGYQN